MPKNLLSFFFFHLSTKSFFWSRIERDDDFPDAFMENLLIQWIFASLQIVLLLNIPIFLLAGCVRMNSPASKAAEEASQTDFRGFFGQRKQ